MPEEEDIHAHHNGYQSKDVKSDGGLSSHRFILRFGGSPDVGRAVSVVGREGASMPEGATMWPFALIAIAVVILGIVVARQPRLRAWLRH